MTEPFLPSDEGADQVLRAARHRRLLKASGVGSSAALLVVGVLLVSVVHQPGRRGEPDRLTSTTSPSPDGARSAAPTVTPAPTRPPAEGLQPGVRPGPTPAGVDPLDPVLGTPSPGAASPPPPQSRSTTKRVSPISRTRGTIASTDLCDGGATDATRSWCVRAFDPGQIRRGRSVALGGEFCVFPTSKAVTLRFASTREVDISLAYDSGVAWQGGEGVTYRSPGPELTVNPGECLRWRSSWDTRDREGFVVPPGLYYLTFGISSGFGASVTTSVEVVD